MSQVLQVKFQGLDEGSDPKALPPGTLLVAENCAMDKERRLVKRDGTTGLAKTLVAGSTVTAGKRLLSTGADIAIANTETTYARVSELAKWQPIDRQPALRVTRKALVDSTRSAGSVDIAVSGSLLVSLYSVTSGTTQTFVQVQDLNTGKVLMVPTIVKTSAAFPRVIVSGTSAHLFYSVNGAVKTAALDLTTLVLGGEHTLVADAVAGSPTVFDVVIATISGTPTVFLAYEKDSGTNRLTLADFNLSTRVAVDTETTYSCTGLVSVCVAVSTSTSRVFLVFTGTTSNLTRLVTTSTALGAVAGPTTVYSGLASTVFVDELDSSNALVGWVRDDGSFTSAERLTTITYGSTSHSGSSPSERITFGLYAASKPWSVAGRWYVSVMTYLHTYSTTSTLVIPQPSRVVVEIETAASISGYQDGTHPHVATLENQTTWFTPLGLLIKVATDSSGNVYIPAPYRNIEPPNATITLPLGWNVYRLAVSEGDLFRQAQIGAGALCAAGASFWFDGASTMPYGFSHAPHILSITASNNSGVIVAGTYSYVAVYAWKDANGVTHRSIPSVPFSGTTASSNLTLDIKVSTASLSGKRRRSADQSSPVLVELYRTTIGGAGPHYRLTLEPTYQVLTNDPSAADVTLRDTKADADIAGGAPVILLSAQAQLYTDLGELANVPPPAFVTVTTHRGRLVGLASDLRTVWMSKDSTVDATLAPGFNEALTLAFARDKTAFASLDEKLVVFGATNIDAVFGDGPDDTGAGNDWQIQAVQTDVGCTNPRCVAVCPMGAVFQSARGIELLDRGLTVTWIGHVVEDTLAAFPTITSAVLVPAESEVRFTCNAANGATGIVLAWDYLNKIWFTRKYNDAADTAAASVPFIDAALIDGVYTLLTAGGQVYQETAAHKLDNGTAWVGRDVVIAPISPAGNLAWHRVKDVQVLGTSVTNHDLKISIARDYAASYAQTQTFLAGSTATVIGPLEQAKVALVTQKCQAVKIRLQDLTPTSPGSYPVSTGDGPIFEGLAFRVSVKRGLPLLASGQEG